MAGEKFEISVDNNIIKIHIDEMLHLAIKQSELIGIQSWVKGDGSGTYCIEFSTRTRNILAEYSTIDKWKNVLRFLDGVDLFGNKL